MQTTALQDQRKILREKIQNWEALRAIYMPGLLQIQTDLGRNPIALWNSSPNPEEVDLWLPSSLASNRRYAACADGLSEMELHLRIAQCSSSLEGLRQVLRVKTRMVYFKNKNIRGQREGTRSRAIIDRVHSRAIRFVQKYRAARTARFNLEGPGEWEQTYRELHNEDIRGFASGKPKNKPPRRGIWEDGHAPSPPVPAENESDDEDESDPDLNDDMEVRLPPKKKRKTGTGETRKNISWIWQTIPLSLNSDEDDDVLRAEWARSRARVHRTTEEVALVREEMRRVIEFLEWRAQWWEQRISCRRDVSSEVKEGLEAYVVKQAALQRALSASFQVLWKTPLARVEDLLEGADDSGGNTDAPHQDGANNGDNNISNDNGGINDVGDGSDNDAGGDSDNDEIADI